MGKSLVVSLKNITFDLGGKPSLAAASSEAFKKKFESLTFISCKSLADSKKNITFANVNKKSNQ